MTHDWGHFLAAPPDPGSLYVGSYDPLLVVASFLIAAFAALAALAVAGRMRSAKTAAARANWLLVGALALGGGIWSMHFVGMLAFRLPLTVRYDPVLTAASMLPGVLASAAALWVVSRKDLHWGEIAGGGGVLGAGIAAMHHMGMAAMRINARMSYDPRLFALSLLVAVALAVIALSIRFQVDAWRGRIGKWSTPLSAVVMGGAITGMHYMAMSAAYFQRNGDAAAADGGLNPTFLATIIVVVSGLLIALVLSATVAVRYVEIVQRLRNANDALRQAASVFDNTAEGIMITDAAARIVSVNPAFSRVTGYAAAEVLGLTPRVLRSGRHDDAFYRALYASLAAQGHWEGEIWNRRKNGEIYPELLTINAIHGRRGVAVKYVALFRDITLIKRTQDELERLAHFDPLTGLPNRALLAERLNHALERHRRSGGELAIMVLDLDGFKTVNDSLGHPAGDRLLQVVARRLAAALRAEDTVARLGGDEFAVILEDVKHGGDAAEVARKLLHSLAAPVDLGDHSALVTASVGIALFPPDGDDGVALLKAADTAMYESKQGGRNTFQFHHCDMAQAVRRRLDFEAGLRRALAGDELEVWYQPQVDLADGKVVGAEALLRWRDPEIGLIQPADFIALAEDTGLIIPIGEWVLNRACADVRRWRDRFGWPGKVSINVAGPQIGHGDFHFDVLRALGAHALPAQALELEITETFIMQNAANALDVVKQLGGLGITTAIDDFGTGYSSLAYLKHLPIDRLKIDRGFVMDLPGDRDDAAIVRAVIALGASLGFTVIAEGVETEAQRDFLIQAGCNQGQGYLFSRPLPVAEFEAWLQPRA
ncbi:MAG: EAL domain-containing protein [Rhodocyclaceae bacterium]|nr:EAL domain-containing protein [Rhodocyclaceae bacterium]